jgi:site-specific DNA-methyltransferase (adenine-specific)
MGKRWDYDVPSVEVWAECLRVLKPGGHLLAFAGTRTQHRMAVRIEDAGFEIRDMIAWVYGSGFPKSLNIGKAFDKINGELVETTETLFNNPTKKTDLSKRSDYGYKFEPKSTEAKQWQGWGTALKPALEPITVARKPLIGTVAENVLQHGTGAINVDGGRVGTEGGTKHNDGEKGKTKNCYGNGLFVEFGKPVSGLGRWPANFIHDGSEEATDLLGASARFFYCAKASKADRGENHHPTVKPTDLMRYLCRLVTPPSGIVLDPFMGSGSTGKAAMLEGFAFVGIEREAEYIDIAKARIQSAVGLL